MWLSPFQRTGRKLIIIIKYKLYNYKIKLNYNSREVIYYYATGLYHNNEVNTSITDTS